MNERNRVYKYMLKIYKTVFKFRAKYLEGDRFVEHFSNQY